MTAELPPHRRGNGLPASSFVPLADVEPRLGEHLLDLLRFADIAAFLEPPNDPRAARRPGVGMVQRLYVEQAKRDEARAVVEAAADEAGGTVVQEAPAEARDLLRGLDTDAEFARLVAGWDAPAAATGPTDPANPADGDEQDDPVEAPDDFERFVERRVGPPPSLDEVNLEDEHYEPPTPPPLPIPEPATVGAVAVFLAGLLVIWKGSWVGLGGEVAFPLGMVLVLAGIVLLVLRLRDDDPDEDDTDDDGARL